MPDSYDRDDEITRSTSGDLTARAVNAGVLSAIARVPIKQRTMVLDACVSLAIQMTEK